MQDSYTLNQQARIVGQLQGHGHRITTGVNQSTSLRAGIVVVQGGTNDRGIIRPAGTGGIVAGVVMWQENVDNQALAGEEVWPVNSAVPLVETGDVVCYGEVAMAKDDPVFFRHTAAGAEVLGAIRNDADTADADEITAARVKYPSTGAGPVVITMNLP